MAETVKIEIPVSVTDKTASGVSSIQKRFTSLDKSLEKTQKRLDKLGGGRYKFDLEMEGHASDKIADVEDALQKVHGSEARMSVTASDDATDVINNVSDAAGKLNGEGAVVEAEADDAATGVLSDVDDRLSELNGGSAVVDVEADDAASGVIDEVSGKAAELDGSTITVLLQAEDNITGAIGNAASASRTPIAGAATAMGASFGVYDSLTTFADFESAMSQVKAISGATGAEFDALTTKAKQMGASTKFTATESAEAFNYMAMAGWKTDDMLAGIEGIMNLAAASGESLGTTSDIVTDALTAFGMQASDSTHFADVLAQASANANTNVSMLGESFKYVGPLAGAMKYKVEDTALALGLMANAGVKSSMSGTALRRAITALTSPTEKQANAMAKYGIAATREDGSIKSLNEVMVDLRKNLSGLSEAEQTAAVSTMFGSQATAGMLAIINASEKDFRDLEDAVYHADGAAERMADTMLDNVAGSFTLMQSAIEGVKDELGERLAPYFRSLADGITDAMPGATAVIQGIMDKVDEMAGKWKSAIRSMTSSEEWQNAGILDKIDIAWDTLIATPFKTWAEGEGATSIGGAVKTLFEKAFNIFGEDAGITDWASAAIIAKGGLAAAEGVKDLVGALSALPGSAGIAIGAAALIAGAVTAIGFAIDHYNAIEVKNNLDEHFGNLHLSAEEAAAFAGQIIPIEGLTAELHIANTKFAEGASLRIQAEGELAKINTLQWKLQKATLNTSETDLSELKAAAKTFRDTIIQEMESNEEGTTSFVNAILGDKPEASQISAQLSEWFSIDMGKVDSISNSVQKLIESSINSGVESVETATAISILQAKMMEIANGASAAQLQGKLDWFNIVASGAALDADSWASVAKNVGSIVNEYLNEDAPAYQSFLGQLAQLEMNDKSRSGEIESIRNVIADAYNYKRNTSSQMAWEYLYGSLMDSYGKEYEEAKATIADYDIGNYETGWENLGSAVLDFGNALPTGTQGALLDRFEKMLPTANALKRVIDNATEPVPESIMNAYKQAVELGALSGYTDDGIMEQYWANMIAENYPTKEDFAQAISEQGYDFEAIPEAYKEAIERAFTETTAEVDYSGLLNSIFENIEGTDVDWAAVRDILLEAGYDITDALAEQGIDIGEQEVPVTGNVVPEMSGLVSGISEIGGFFGDVISSKNDLPGLARDTILGAIGAIDLGTIPAKADAQVTEVNTEEARQEMEQEVDNTFGEPVEEETPVNDNLNETDNLPEVYNAFEQKVISMFGNQIPVTTPVSITLDWHITNPSASIGVSTNGGSATASISSGGFANGGFVNGAMLSLIGEDGPEYIIPVGSKRRERGAELWAKAGQALGMFEGIPAYADGGLVGEEEKSLQNPFEQRKEAEGFFQGLFGSEPDKSISTVFAGLPAVAGSPQGVNNTNTNGVNVNVNMSPVIQIDGANLDEEKVFEVMKNRIAEVADDVADEVGMKLVKAYANMPLASGV